tara:strand:- start:308 stop:475 length:168 start_codon:yes stop_codon:yes gene_type:complete
MIKQGTDFFKLTNEQARKLRKACKIAGLSFTAMAARPVDALKLIGEVQNRKGVKL